MASALTRGAAPSPSGPQMHLLAYMLPYDESYLRGSSLARPGAPLSPSAANIKANAVAGQPPLSISKNGSTASKFRRLYTGANAEDADELNEAAGSTLVEPTPVARRLRSRTSRA